MSITINPMTGSYVCCSGESVAFYPTDSVTSASYKPIAIVTMPTFAINGGPSFQGLAWWAPPNKTSTCALIALPAPYKVNPGDVVSVTAPAGWMTCGAGPTDALSIANMVNAVDAMPPPVASVTPTFKPGFNITSSHQSGGLSNLLRNRRLSAGWANGAQGYDAGGNPSSLGSRQANAYLVYPGNNTGLAGDNTGLPGVPGPYGVIWDDGAYGTANQCNISLSSPVGTLSTVSNVSVFTNAGSGGTGQAAVYLVSKAAGTTKAICPVQMTWTMPSWNSTTNKYPAISNLYVILPRDLVTRYSGTITVQSGGTTISFATSQSGLTGLTLWVEGDASNGLYQIASGSGTSWTLATAYGGASGTFKNLYWGTLPNGPISIDRSQPYQLSRYFTDLFPSGVGTLRWMNTTVGQAAVNQMSQRWETHQLGEFTYDYAGGRVNQTITPTSGQPFTLATSPYFYGSQIGSPWLSTATVGGSLASLAAGTTDTLVLSSATAATDPIMYGLVLGLNVGGANQEFVSVMGVNSDNQTLTVLRGACNYSNLTSSPNSTAALPPTTAPAHSPGEPITIYCRKAWTSLNQFGGGNTQTAEFVTSGNHNLVAGVYYGFNGDAQNMLDTEGKPFVYTYQFGAWPTAPNRFVLFGLNSLSHTGPTLQASYSNAHNLKLTVTNPPGGYPWEIPGMVGTALSCDTHYCVPLSASDDLIYDQATRVLANSRVGGKIIVELADEPWNENSGNPQQFLCTMHARINGTPYNGGSTWFTIRAAQAGNIWRSVFATAGRQNEIVMLLNVVQGGYATSANPAVNGGVPCIFGALTQTTYSGGDNQPNTLGYGAYYCNQLVPQSGTNNPDYVGAICDYTWHSIAFNLAGNKSNSYTAQLGDYPGNAADVNGYIDAYNTANATSYPHVYDYYYEGDMDEGAPGLLPTNSLDTWTDTYGNSGPNYTVTHDWVHDPTMRWYQKAFYALMQQAGFAGGCAYTLDYGYYYNAAWTYTEGIAQWPGRGDGSDGLADNRLYRATPGLANSIPKSGGNYTINQPSVTVNPRLQAHQEWMASLGPTTPTQLSLYGPATGAVGVTYFFSLDLDLPDSSAAVTVGLTSSDGTDTLPSSVTIPQGSSTADFSFTPGDTGARTITATVSGLTLTYRGIPFTFTVASTSTPTTATLGGPSQGQIETLSSAFTVTLDAINSAAAVPVIPASSMSGDTFTPLTIPIGQLVGLFYLTPGSTVGSREISITTSPALTYAGSPISYNALTLATQTPWSKRLASVTVPAANAAAANPFGIDAEQTMVITSGLTPPE